MFYDLNAGNRLWLSGKGGVEKIKWIREEEIEI